MCVALDHPREMQGAPGGSRAALVAEDAYALVKDHGHEHIALCSGDSEGHLAVILVQPEDVKAIVDALMPYYPKEEGD